MNNQCSTINGTTDSTTSVNARQTLVTESQHREMIVQVITVRLVKTQTMVISDRQMGHPRACCSKWATHDAQNR